MFRPDVTNALPRTKDMRHLPDRRKTNGQAWLNWAQIYKWVSPYVNVPMGLTLGTTVLPSTEQVSADLDDGFVMAKTRYAGLNVSHRGPAPIGVLVLPTEPAAWHPLRHVGAAPEVVIERLAVLVLEAPLRRRLRLARERRVRLARRGRQRLPSWRDTRAAHPARPATTASTTTATA